MSLLARKIETVVRLKLVRKPLWYGQQNGIKVEQWNEKSRDLRIETRKQGVNWVSARHGRILMKTTYRFISQLYRSSDRNLISTGANVAKGRKRKCCWYMSRLYLQSFHAPSSLPLRANGFVTDCRRTVTVTRSFHSRGDRRYVVPQSATVVPQTYHCRSI